jgi:hypothetical protein
MAIFWRPIAPALDWAALLLVLIPIGLGSSKAVWGEDRLAIYLENGRQLAGAIDSRTDDSALWIVSHEPHAVLRSRIQWDRIRRVEQDGAVLSIEELRVRAAQVAAAADDEPRSGMEAAVLGDDAPPGGPHSEPTDDRVLPPLPMHEAGCVQSLDIWVEAGNLDGDVAIDGLRILLSPLDALGRVVPVDGQVDFILIGERVNVPAEQAWRYREPFPELGRWTERIRSCDFGPHGVTCQLELRGPNVEADIKIGPQAVLYARLGVSGQGVFEASDDDVCLRACSYLRDQLQFRQDRRFFRQEGMPTR